MIHEFLESLPAPIKNLIDAFSFTAAFASAAQIVPVVAGLLSIAWYCVRFYDRYHKKQGDE